MIEKCPACLGSKSGKPVFTRTGELNRCARCGSLWRSEGPVYSDYGMSYFSNRGHLGEKASVRAAKIKSFRGFWKRASVPPSSKALEIGCATGWGLVAGRELGMQMHGLDVAAESDRLAMERGFPPGTVVQHLEQLETLRFPVVGFFDALEHIPEPEQFLEKLKHYLAPEACLIVVLPRADSLSRYCLGSMWPHFLPDHWLHFSARGFEIFAGRCGFDLAKTFFPLKWVTPFTLFRHLSLHSGIELAAPSFPIFPFNIGECGYVLRWRRPVGTLCCNPVEG